MHSLFRRWLSRKAVDKPDFRRLPWWGILLHTKDKAKISALLESGERLSVTLQTEGWKDVESVIFDWIERYSVQATQLGQKLEEKNGQLVLLEEDTQADDRRRLIACAQASALKGLLAEIRQRSRAKDLMDKRQSQEDKLKVDTGELI